MSRHLKNDCIKNSKNDKLVSLDVRNMLGKILKEELIKMFGNNSMNVDPNKVQKTNLINEIINQNHCRFNNKFFKQTVGLAVALPLLPILAKNINGQF